MGSARVTMRRQTFIIPILFSAGSPIAVLACIRSAFFDMGFAAGTFRLNFKVLYPSGRRIRSHRRFP